MRKLQRDLVASQDSRRGIEETYRVVVGPEQRIHDVYVRIGPIDAITREITPIHGNGGAQETLATELGQRDSVRTGPVAGKSNPSSLEERPAIPFPVAGGYPTGITREEGRDRPKKGGVSISRNRKHLVESSVPIENRARRTENRRGVRNMQKYGVFSCHT